MKKLIVLALAAFLASASAQALTVADLKDKLASLPGDAVLYIKDVPGSNYGLVRVIYEEQQHQNGEPAVEKKATVLIQ